MSSVIASSAPATRTAPTTPAAGPETSATAGCAAASASVASPPEDRITSGSDSPTPAAATPSASRYRATTGPR